MLPNSRAEQAVIDVSKARMEATAKRDTAAWARFVANDCLFVQDDGSLISKDGMLTRFKKVSTAYDRNKSPHD